MIFSNKQHPRQKSSAYDDYVAAHEAAAHCYCPESYRLSFLNASVTQDARQRMQDGTDLHDKWARSAPRPRRNKPLLYIIIILIIILIKLLLGGEP